jgi:hypothetical protein
MVKVFFLTGNCLCHSSILIRNDCYRRLGLYDPLMRQLPDLDMWVRLCGVWEIFIHPEPLTQFRLRSGNANASADVSSNHERGSYELTKILERFSRLPLSDQLPQIFPELFADAKTDDQRLQRLAELAMEVNSTAHQFFGLDCLRELMKASKLRSEKLSARLLELGLRANPFSPASKYLRIFHRTAGHPFTSGDSQSFPLRMNSLQAERISMPIPLNCIQLRIDPAEQIAIIVIFRLSVTDNDGVEIWDFKRAFDSMEILNAKRISTPDRPFRMLALTDDPQIILPEICALEGWHLNLSLSAASDIGGDLQKLFLGREKALQRNESLQIRIRELEDVVESAQVWQKKPWFKRAFSRWNPPKD